jgi:hypothetical protein
MMMMMMMIIIIIGSRMRGKHVFVGGLLHTVVGAFRRSTKSFPRCNLPSSGIDSGHHLCPAFTLYPGINRGSTHMLLATKERNVARNPASSSSPSLLLTRWPTHSSTTRTSRSAPWLTLLRTLRDTSIRAIACSTRLARSPLPGSSTRTCVRSGGEGKREGDSGKYKPVRSFVSFCKYKPVRSSVSFCFHPCFSQRQTPNHRSIHPPIHL